MTLTISAPSAISLGNMTTGHISAQSLVNGVVSSNASNWEVSVKAANADPTTGYMHRSDGLPLKNQLLIGKTVNPTNNASAGFTWRKNEGDSIPLYIEQEISSSDKAGNYSITIVFMGTPN